MSSDLTISASVRSDTGKGASRRLRRNENRVPGIIYGADKEPVMISLLQKDLAHEAETEAFFSSILDLDLDGAHEKVVVQDLQRHPAKKLFIHIDFLRVDAATKLTMNVPLHFVNEEACIGVKDEDGIVVHSATEIEVQCLPADLPEYIEIDMIAMKLGDTLMLSDIKLPEGVESIVLSHGEEYDQPVAAIQQPRAAVEEEDEAEAAEADAEDDAAEGDEPAEDGDDDKGDDA